MSTSHASSSQKPTLYVASDHAGWELKNQLVKSMSDVHWVDLGPESDGRVDYPDYADQVALKIAEGAGQGVLICGSGQGMAMRANRYTKVRAALVWNDETVRLARGHNDANILCLGARLIDLDTAKRLVRLFLETPFEGGRHADRVEKLSRKP